MGSTEEGSPRAAQRAHDPERGRERGFLGRLLDTLGGSSEEEAAAAEEAAIAGTGLLGVANLRRMRLDDVSIPRAEIVAVPVDIPLDALVEVFRESGNSRLPVYEGSLDQPLGLLLLKDLALSHGFNGNQHELDLRVLLRPLIYAPPSMPIGVLLQKMRSERTHMALVIDEYGGVDGLVTIEDLIEQVVGEIDDEHDTEDDASWTEESPGVWLVQARTPLDEFERALGESLAAGDDDEEVDTLGGLVFLLAGRVPVRGEIIPHPAGLDIEIVEGDSRRIKRLRVRRADVEDRRVAHG
ncbi:MAG: CBS domain-containing protein [Rhodobacteraceae bacterium]|nr:CBS domain-containing protein [Paracoccaceae bacterium]